MADDGAELCGAPGTSGFICPDCMQDFVNSDKLINHFQEVHQSENVQSLKKIPDSNKPMVSGLEEKVHLQEDLIASLRDHNSNLLKRLACDKKLVNELKSILKFVIGQYPFNTSTKISEDKDLERQLTEFFENQTEITTTISKVDAYEEDLKKKSTEIEELKSQNKELLLQIISLENSIAKTKELGDINSQIPVKTELISNQTQTDEIDSERPDQDPDSQLLKLNEDKVKLESQLADQNVLIANFQTQIQELQVTNKTLNEKLQTNQMLTKTLTEQLNQSKLDNQIKEKELQSQVDNLTTQLKQANSLNESLKSNYNLLQSESDRLKKSLTQSEGQVEQLNCQLVEKNANLQNELTISKKEVDSLMERLIQMEDTNTNLQKDVDEKANKIREIQIAMMELARENQSLRVMRDRDMNRQWTKDDEAPTCFTCDREFSISLRRHHCRHCGNVFCNNCSSHRASIAASKDPVRVCLPCFMELVENQ